MSFEKAAKDFLVNPGPLPPECDIGMMQDTVKFLLEKGHIGKSNHVATDTIIQYLRSLGHTISRERWQTSVLGPLKDHGIYIGSVIGLGIFIIKDEDDARAVRKSHKKRVKVEERRLKILEKLLKSYGWKL